MRSIEQTWLVRLLLLHTNINTNTARNTHRLYARDFNQAAVCCCCCCCMLAHVQPRSRFTHIIKCSALNDDHRSHLIDKLHLFY